MTHLVTLAGSGRVPLTGSRLIGPVDKSESASLLIRVRARRDPAELEEWVKTESIKPLADRRYLSNSQLSETFGANSEDLDSIESYVAKHNLVVIKRSNGERSLLVKGRLGDLLSAFPANINLYHHSQGPYRGRSGAIYIPQEFDRIITGIFGYDTRRRHKGAPKHRVSTYSGPGGGNGESPLSYAARYSFPKAYQGIALDGTGQTIAILELGGGFQMADLQIYFSEVGTPMPNVVLAAPIDGVTNTPSTPDSADGEVMLDIEVAGAVAPKATIVVYFAPNSGDLPFVEALSHIIYQPDRPSDIISISWGGPEPKKDPQDLQINQLMAALHELLAAAASKGITVCVASGDHGSVCEDAADWDGGIHVSAPASDPYSLACGGTQIDSNNNDIVWNDGMPFDLSSNDGGGWASGGGISQWWPVPSYQAGANIPVSIDGGNVGRGLPDIAMCAVNYFVRVDSQEQPPEDGTSAVAPLMAALIALLNQAKQKNVGFFNPFLYSNTAHDIVNDVTQGTNAIAGTAPGYNAGPGWDACTGLGTPNGTSILNAL